MSKHNPMYRGLKLMCNCNFYREIQGNIKKRICKITNLMTNQLWKNGYDSFQVHDNFDLDSKSKPVYIAISLEYDLF